MKFLIRWSVILFLLFFTYNPLGYSYFHWIFSDQNGLWSFFHPTKFLVGVLLSFGWGLLIWMAWTNVHFIGILLIFFLASVIFYVVNYYSHLTAASLYFIYALVAVCIAAILIWPQVRRKITGVISTDNLGSADE